MTSTDFDKLQHAVEKAVDLDSSAQESYLQALAIEDPDLARQVRRLLQADDSASSGLTRPIGQAMQDTFDDDGIDYWIGKPVGAYRITARIGEGGMGAVFLGQRDDDAYEGQVAIKIMSERLLNADAVNRFLSERQILATLNHPNIARLLDGGSTDTDLPYLVLEYIDGQHLDTYCEAEQLNLEQRLALFQRVCTAVDFAHQNLVVHRDLKPSNILIDKSGDVKLLDFGIAKLVDEQSGNDMALTGEANRILTPEYASPEQIRGEPVSVTTDVYALGVLLYRLLTGQSPYAGETKSTSIQDAVLSVDPPRPSTMVGFSTTTADGNDSLPRGIGETPQILKRELAGDLDNIILKCLQKDRTRRYPAARDIAADIERYLRLEPVQAAADSWQYRLSKFARRRARPLVAVGIVLSSIIGLVTFSSWRVAQERDAAQFAAAQANEVADFMLGLFDGASPTTAQGDTITATDLLAEGVERINELSDQPRLQASLLQKMGESYMHLGKPTQAVTLQQRAVNLYRDTPSTDKKTYATALHDLAESQRLNGEYQAAELNIREAIRIREEAFGTESPEVARTLGRLGTLLFDIRDHPQARDVLEKALAMKERSSPTPDRVTLNIIGNLSITLDSMGEYGRAEELMRENVEMSGPIIGELHPTTIIRLANLELVLGRTGQYLAAEETALEVLRRADAVWPEYHPNRALYTMALAHDLLPLGKIEDSRRYAKEGLRLAEGGSSEDSFRYINRLRSFGGLSIEYGDFAEAEAALKRAYDLSVKHRGEESYNTMRVVMYRGRLASRLGRHDEAESWLRRVAYREDILGSSYTNLSKNWLANALSEQGKFTEADTVFAEALEANSAVGLGESAIIIPLRTDQVRHLRRQGKLSAARALAEATITLGEKTLPAGNWMIAETKGELALILHDAGETAAAAPFAATAVDVLTATFGGTDSRV